VSLPINSSQSLFALKKASIFASGFGFVRSLKFLAIEIFIDKQVIADFFKRSMGFANDRFVRLLVFQVINQSFYQ